MDASFIPVEVVPITTPFGLDQLRRSYKTALSATDAIAAAPVAGTADETFPNMFLMPITTPESAESATRIDLTYMGCFGGAAGSPTLPDQKHDNSNSVQSASSSFTTTGVASSGSISAQFYAPETTLSYFSFGAIGTDVVADPTDDIQIITFVSSSGASVNLDNLAAVWFNERITSTLSASEIVPGQYWQNVSRKTKTLTPPTIAINSSGFFLQIAANGAGYTVGDTLTFTVGGESAVVTVISVISGGKVNGWTVTSNTFTAAHAAVAATGGTGTGCAANILSV